MDSSEQPRHHELESKITKYEINGLVVSVGEKLYRPLTPKIALKDTIITSTAGWAMPNGAIPHYEAKGIDRLNQSIAETLGNEVFGLNTEIDRNPEGSLLCQAEALANHVMSLITTSNIQSEVKGESERIKNILMLCYSEGGIVALLAAYFIRQSHHAFNTTVIGVNPVGVHEHHPISMARRFVMDAGIVSSFDLRNLQALLQSGRDIGLGLFYEMRGKLSQYPKRLWTQIVEMSALNLAMDEYTGNYGIIQASGDSVSNPRKTLGYNSNSTPKELKAALRKRFPNANHIEALVLSGHHPLPVVNPDLVSENIAEVLNKLK